MITSIGHHGLDHPVPLCQNSLTSPGPLSWTSQTVLVGGGGAEQYTECHSGVGQKQPENTGSHPKLVCYLIHVVDKVNLDGVPWTGYVPETETCVKTTCLTKPAPLVDFTHRNTFWPWSPACTQPLSAWRRLKDTYNILFGIRISLSLSGFHCRWRTGLLETLRQIEHVSPLKTRVAHRAWISEMGMMAPSGCTSPMTASVFLSKSGGNTYL